MTVTADRFTGCVLGLALGDAMGAPREGGVLERLLWRCIGTTRRGEMRWTDDTQMSIAVMESLIAHGTIDSDDLARRFAAGYRWSRGYGPGTATLLRRVRRGGDWREENRRIHPEGSFGNGAAMRAPIVGLCFAAAPEKLEDAVYRSSIVTHAHPLALKGALVIALATAGVACGLATLELLELIRESCGSEEVLSRLWIASGWLASDSQVEVREIRRGLGNGIAAHESCVTAVYLALAYRDGSFLDMQRLAASLGGDVDTIGAMAGAIWGAANGVGGLPAEPLGRLEARARLVELADALYRRTMGG